MNIQGSAANYHVLSIIESCSRQGINRAELISAAGICEHSLTQPYERQPASKVLKLWQSAAQLTDNVLIPFYVGSMSTSMQRCAITTLLEASSTLGQALELGIRYQHLTQNIIKSYVYYDEDFGHMIIDNNGLDYELVRPQIERQIAFVVAIAKNLSPDIDNRFSGVEVNFKTAAKVNTDIYEKVLGVPVKFGCTSDQIIFPRKILNLSNFSACGEIQASILPLIHQHERDLLHGQGMRSQVRQIIADSLGHTEIDIDEIAQNLNISTRTLQRRLQDEHTHFSEVYDDVRKQRALKMVTCPDLCMHELSFHLGFNHITSFYTAFHRWTNLAPIQYRKKQLDRMTG